MRSTAFRTTLAVALILAAPGRRSGEPDSTTGPQGGLGQPSHDQEGAVGQGDGLLEQESLHTAGPGMPIAIPPRQVSANPMPDLPVSRGVHADRFGNRNDLTAAYAAFSPRFQYDADGDHDGGIVLGRASGQSGRTGQRPLPQSSRNGQSECSGGRRQGPAVALC